MTRVLLVEDNPTDVRMLQRSFSYAPDWETEISVADDGRIAIDNLRSIVPTPDLVVLDMNLPRVDGMDVLREIRTKLPFTVLPVIIFSSWLEDDIRDRMEHARLKANGYFTKPSGLDAFLGMAIRFRLCYETTNHA